MVEYNTGSFSLDNIFGSLADPTRRDILKRLSVCELSVSEIAAKYDMSIAAVSKHLKVLERAKLIIKRRRGKEKIAGLAPQAFADADEYLRQYRQMWQSRYDKLEKLLNEQE